MSDINLKALRDLTEMTVAASASHQMSMPAGRLLQILDRLESAERRAEEAEKERDAQKEISRGLVAHMQAITDAAGLPSDYVLSDVLISLDALRKDADRYAFVRMAATSDDDHYQDAMAREAERFDGQIPDAAMFDSLIDAVMAQEGGSSNSVELHRIDAGAETPNRNTGNGVDAGVEGGAEQSAPMSVYAWAVTGMAQPFFGEFAEQDARAEAQRVGGTAEAFPLFRGVAQEGGK